MSGQGGEERTNVAAELQALRAQVSRVEESLDKVLASLQERTAAVTPAAADAVSRRIPSDFADDPSKIREASSEGGDALPDGVEHLAVDADSSP